MPAPPPGLIIRPASVADAPQYHVLCTLPGTTAGTNQMPSNSPEHYRDRLESMIGSPNTHAFVAELGGRLVGNATLHLGNNKRRHTGDVGVMVHDDYVDQGIGRALMERLLDLADNWLGLKRVELDVMADNARAIHLYESLGFEREGIKRAAMFRDGAFVDLLMMGRVREG